MASSIVNQGLGSMNGFATIINNNWLANSAFVLSLWISSATDATWQDLDTVAAAEADGNIAEVTDVSYARIVLTDSDIGAITVTDGADTASFDIADQTWSSLAGGDSITKMTVAFDEDTGAGTDANLLLVAQYDCGHMSNGGDLTVAPHANGLWSAAPA